MQSVYSTAPDALVFEKGMNKSILHPAMGKKMMVYYKKFQPLLPYYQQPHLTFWDTIIKYDALLAEQLYRFLFITVLVDSHSSFGYHFSYFPIICFVTYHEIISKVDACSFTVIDNGKKIFSV